MEIPKLQAKASVLPFEKMASNPNVSQGEKLSEASRQFEAMLVRQILQESHKTSLSSDKSNSNISGIYNDMVDNQIADGVSRAGAFGLAKSLQAQLVHQVLPKTASMTAATPAPKASQPNYP